MSKKDDKTLKESCDYIRYELIMLHHSMFRLTDKWVRSVYADCNSYVESYAIHIRNLIEFIRCKPKGDYIRAIEYLDKDKVEEWNKFISKYNSIFNKILEKASPILSNIFKSCA